MWLQNIACSQKLISRVPTMYSGTVSWSRAGGTWGSPTLNRGERGHFILKKYFTLISNLEEGFQLQRKSSYFEKYVFNCSALCSCIKFCVYVRLSLFSCRVSCIPMCPDKGLEGSQEPGNRSCVLFCAPEGQGELSPLLLGGASLVWDIPSTFCQTKTCQPG